ncbi:MAG: FemAB family XrtA/PEP-CTERM system-associated protein [Alphaproteobacteria bacterium]
MSVTIREIDGDGTDRWDEFVRACPEGTFFHLSGWKSVIERSFGHRAYFLSAESGGGIAGVLPLVHVRGRFFSNALISSAFCIYGGTLALDDSAGRALDEAACALADRLGVDYLEYRNRRRTHPDWACNADLYVTFRKRLDPVADRNLRSVRRKMIRKAVKAGVETRIDGDVETFFPLYAESVRNHGTPVFSKAYFRNLKAQFGDDCEILTVLQGGRPVAGLLSFYFRDEVLPYYAGSIPAARAVAAHDYMYWDVMRRACESGHLIYDLGRSKRGSGSYAFKEHWNFEPAPLFHEYRLRPGCAMPNVNPFNPKYRLLIAAWRCLPLPVANWLGPFIARDLG